jgi:hypothetical protein
MIQRIFNKEFFPIFFRNHRSKIRRHEKKTGVNIPVLRISAGKTLQYPVFEKHMGKTTGKIFFLQFFWGTENEQGRFFL